MGARTATTHEWTCPNCGQRYVNTNQVHSCNRQTIDEFFGDDHHSRTLFDHVEKFLQTLGPIDVAATKTQIAFRSRIRFAYLWFINRVRRTKTPELILTFDLRRREGSPRIRTRVNPRSDLWTHHLPLHQPSDLDEQVRTWLREAHQAATRTPTRRNRGR